MPLPLVLCACESKALKDTLLYTKDTQGCLFFPWLNLMPLNKQLVISNIYNKSIMEL